MRCGVDASRLRAPQPNAREKTRDRKMTLRVFRNKRRFGTVIYRYGFRYSEGTSTMVYCARGLA